MRYVMFTRSGVEPEPGIMFGEQVIGLGATGFPDILSIIQGGADAVKQVEKYLSEAPTATPLTYVKLLAPIARPPKLICVGLNYRDHAAESKMEIPKVPTIFCKFPTAVIGPGDPIVLPKNSQEPDYEAEMAFVIGKGGRHIPADRWQEHVFGYTNLNDVSARDFQRATSQWIMGKTFDTFAPMGPAIVTPDEAGDPHALDIRLTINSEVFQHSNTRHLIFGIPDLIAYLSSVFTLEPGDVVSTGTPAGVGFARKPPRFLRHGDVVAVSLQGLGELRNPCVAEA
jgi:2-keto-4-pentenoate hydratase/2-oxohepta-3-ene-1,7-dioic acid hydratase in catechol pathway